MKDLFGKVMLEYAKKKKCLYYIERDDRYIDECKDANRYFWQYKRWPDFEKKAIKYAKGNVLDIGCGAGRHALWMQKKGLLVTGIDNSPLTIKVCKLRGLKDAKIMDLFKLKFKPNTFDTVTMMFNNFGLAGTISKTKKLLRTLHKITKKDGIIIASTLDYKNTSNPSHLSYHKRNKKGGMPQGLIKIRLICKNQKGDWFNLLMVTPKEMRNIIKGTGWKIQKLIKDKFEYIAILRRI